jgi:hypothetical protein
MIQPWFMEIWSDFLFVWFWKKLFPNSRAHPPDDKNIWSGLTYPTTLCIIDSWILTPWCLNRCHTYGPHGHVKSQFFIIFQMIFGISKMSLSLKFHGIFMTYVASNFMNSPSFHGYLTSEAPKIEQVTSGALSRTGQMWRWSEYGENTTEIWDWSRFFWDL